jgi:hypothetical protein
MDNGIVRTEKKLYVFESLSLYLYFQRLAVENISTQSRAGIANVPFIHYASIGEALTPAPASRFYRLIRRATEYDNAVPRKPTEAMRTAFYHAFLRWLCVKIEDQCADIEDLLAHQQGDRYDELLQWLRNHDFATLVPSCALAAERELFLTDLNLVVELLVGEAIDQRASA